MIEPGKRKAIYLLHEQNMNVLEISQRFGISKNTVNVIIEQKGVVPDKERKDKIKIDEELLARLNAECEGYKKRVQEKLKEDHGIEVQYATLTKIMRDLEIGEPINTRCDRVPDVAGAEMQQDTSPYKMKIGGKEIRIVGSLIYFRYSKVRYLKFYRAFNRFKMKCFFHEALTYFGYCAPECIIDNTNLARLRGSGKTAVIVPEMEQFARQYGFKYVCHEIGHCNRKAGNERSFYTVETNFFPGRSFSSMEDLNEQARAWSTIKMANTPISKSGLIPAQAFEHEKAYLVKLPPYMEPPYLHLERGTDQYGYAAFDGNHYWVPGTKRFDVTLLQYSDCLKIYYDKKLLAEYKLPAEGVKNESFSPEGFPKPRFFPRDGKPTDQEEKQLRAAGESVGAYLDFTLKLKGMQKRRFTRELFSLFKKVGMDLFIKTIIRALKYRITDIKTIERMVLLEMNDGFYEMPDIEVDNQYKDRESYREGRLTDQPDLLQYDKMFKEKQEE